MTDADLEGLAALQVPARRDLYRFLVRHGGYASRDDAAAAVGIGRGLAAFHLDRLAAAGLVDVAYRRPAGRGGPGAGRPAKLYRSAARQLTVTLPARDYELLARLLAAGLARRDLAPGAFAALEEAARRHGGGLARRARDETGEAADGETLELALRTQGFEPHRTAAGEIELRSCPFEAAARENPDLVCPLALSLVEGLVGELGVQGVAVRTGQRPDGCCVVLRGSAGPGRR